MKIAGHFSTLAKIYIFNLFFRKTVLFSYDQFFDFYIYQILSFPLQGVDLKKWEYKKSGQLLMKYITPAPPRGTGPHRYTSTLDKKILEKEPEFLPVFTQIICNIRKPLFPRKLFHGSFSFFCNILDTFSKQFLEAPSP